MTNLVCPKCGERAKFCVTIKDWRYIYLTADGLPDPQGPPPGQGQSVSISCSACSEKFHGSRVQVPFVEAVKALGF
jgi:hypothetical protein